MIAEPETIKEALRAARQTLVDLKMGRQDGVIYKMDGSREEVIAHQNKIIATLIKVREFATGRKF